MSRFSNFRALNISDNTAEYVLADLAHPETGESPTLIMRPAHAANRSFTLALLKSNAGLANTVNNKKRDVTAKDLAAITNTLRELLADHVVVGWKHVHDAKGAEVAFSKKVCAELLAEIPDDIIENIFTFGQERANFLQTPVDSEEVEAAAKK